MMERQTSRNTCACGRAVYLCIGENTNIATMVSRVFWRPCQDCTIEKAQVCFERMSNWEGRIHCRFDCFACRHQLGYLLWYNTQTKLVGGKEGIKRASESNVYRQMSVGWNVDLQVARVEKRWYIQKRDSFDVVALIEMGGCAYQTCRSIKIE